MESRLLPKVIIRMPIELKGRLRQLAVSNHRTMNGEVVALIEAATRPTEDQKKDQTT